MMCDMMLLRHLVHKRVHHHHTSQTLSCTPLSDLASLVSDNFLNWRMRMLRGLHHVCGVYKCTVRVRKIYH